MLFVHVDSNTWVFLWILQNFYEQFLYRTPPVHYAFLKFYMMIKFFGRLWVQNWYFSYLMCHCFVFLHNSSVRIGSLLLFRTCFDTKSFTKYNFSTILIESLKFRNNSRIIVTSPSNLLWKMLKWVFFFVIYYFSLRAVLGWLKIALPENKLMRKFRRH